MALGMFPGTDDCSTCLWEVCVNSDASNSAGDGL